MTFWITHGATSTTPCTREVAYERQKIEMRRTSACHIVSFLPEVREFIRDTKPRTNTTRSGRRARHPKTTLPHRPPGALSAIGLLGGRPQAPARFWVSFSFFAARPGARAAAAAFSRSKRHVARLHHAILPRARTETQPLSPEPCERHGREMVTHGNGQ